MTITPEKYDELLRAFDVIDQYVQKHGFTIQEIRVEPYEPTFMWSSVAGVPFKTVKRAKGKKA